MWIIVATCKGWVTQYYGPYATQDEAEEDVDRIEKEYKLTIGHVLTFQKLKK